MAKDMSSTAGRKQKIHVFDVVNYIVFILIGLIILVPIWKVLVDSLNAVGVYQFQLYPHDFTLDGYRTIIETSALYRPFINSVITTILGTILGLVLSTLCGYVLVQFDMPGRNIFALSHFQSGQCSHISKIVFTKHKGHTIQLLPVL